MGKGCSSSDLQSRVEISPSREKRREVGKSVCLFSYLMPIQKLARRAHSDPLPKHVLLLLEPMSRTQNRDSSLCFFVVVCSETE